ncbi:MAG: hypothetical protein EPO23_11485 [Xanthobacteraceae bacterium]|nr:MAG: hypothetical protein EPO23_11485 [Xanthobacteraceae bacterium]
MRPRHRRIPDGRQHAAALTPQMRLKTFITVHDQDIILDSETSGKFSRRLSDYQYVFVGSRDCEKVRRKNVVIARELPDNIEPENFFVDFTAWYAIVRNDLADDAIVSLIQYDTAMTETFEAETVSTAAENPNCILGYIPESTTDENFLRNNMGAAPLTNALKDVYGVSLDEVMKNDVPGSAKRSWPATNNVCMTPGILRAFVDWFEPMIGHIGNQPHAGHAFERSIKIFSQHAGIPIIYLPHVMTHFQVNSHGTQNFENRYENFKFDILTNRTVFPERAKSKASRFLAALKNWRR